MTREEAIEVIENGEFWDECIIPCDNDAVIKFHKALDVMIAELQAQQEPVKLDRSRWEARPVERCRPDRHERFEEAKLSEEGEVLYRKVVTINENATMAYCSACGKRLCSRFENYCPSCGRPLTEEAWAELESRVGGAAND